MSDFCVILVHGYMGAATDFEPLAQALEAADIVVTRVNLPGHGEAYAPSFDTENFLNHLRACIRTRPCREYALLGHSTGGSLILAELARHITDPQLFDELRLLILAATPFRIDTTYAQRWGKHLASRHGIAAPALDDLGALARLVNRTTLPPVPTLMLNGEADELVTPSKIQASTAPLRKLTIPNARHHLFHGLGSDMAIAATCRAILDASGRDNAASLVAAVPNMASFIAAWPDSGRHLIGSPAGCRVIGQDFMPEGRIAIEPSLANIEITTRCTLGCTSCARTQLKLQSRHMTMETYQAVLAALPHAWRINLVGLGEPLLHPDVTEFVRFAANQGRRVALVSNAMHLDTFMASTLLDAGLAAITFSLDAMSEKQVERLRKGSDIEMIRSNIRAFQSVRSRRGRSVGTAIFTALTAESIGELPHIIDFALEAGIDALMLSDLNFPSNQDRSLAHHLNIEMADSLRTSLRYAARNGLPVLSVRGLEEYALDSRYLDYLALRGEQLAERSLHHTHCLSPWQTVPVNVDGHASICDCQSKAVLGDIVHIPLDEWWNSPRMVDHRKQMLSETPPMDCLVCPRF